MGFPQWTTFDHCQIQNWMEDSVDSRIITWFKTNYFLTMNSSVLESLKIFTSLRICDLYICIQYVNLNVRIIVLVVIHVVAFDLLSLWCTSLVSLPLCTKYVLHLKCLHVWIWCMIFKKTLFQWQGEKRKVMQGYVL